MTKIKKILIFLMAWMLSPLALSQQDFVMMYQLTKYNRHWPELEPMAFNRIMYQPSFGIKPGMVENKGITRLFYRKTAKKKFDVPKEKYIRKGVQRYKPYGCEVIPQFTVLDIEVWHSGLKVSEGEAKRSIEKYIATLRKVRQYLPDNKFGYYGLPVYRDIKASISDKSSSLYSSWRARNDLHQPLADELDVFYVSLYTFQKDRKRWVKYAREHIAESKRLAKNGQPVIVFLWPEYHDRSRLSGERLSSSFWRLQLETVFEHADGVFIWDNNPNLFSELGWLEETKNFVSQLEKKGISINGKLNQSLNKKGCSEVSL